MAQFVFPSWVPGVNLIQGKGDIYFPLVSEGQLCPGYKTNGLSPFGSLVDLQHVCSVHAIQNLQELSPVFSGISASSTCNKPSLSLSPNSLTDFSLKNKIYKEHYQI